MEITRGERMEDGGMNCFYLGKSVCFHLADISLVTGRQQKDSVDSCQEVATSPATVSKPLQPFHYSRDSLKSCQS